MVSRLNPSSQANGHYTGLQPHGGQWLRYKDGVKRHLKATHITVDHWETLAQDRQQWRQAIHKRKSHIEEKISQKYQHDHNLHHGFPDASAPIIFCVNCGRIAYCAHVSWDIFCRQLNHINEFVYSYFPCCFNKCPSLSLLTF